MSSVNRMSSVNSMSNSYGDERSMSSMSINAQKCGVANRLQTLCGVCATYELPMSRHLSGARQRRLF